MEVGERQSQLTISTSSRSEQRQLPKMLRSLPAASASIRSRTAVANSCATSWFRYLAAAFVHRRSKLLRNQTR